MLKKRVLLRVSLGFVVLISSFGCMCLLGIMTPTSTAVEASEKRTLGSLEIGDRVVDPSWEWEFRLGEDYSGTGEIKPVVWIVVAEDHYGSGSGITLLSEELVGRMAFDNSSDRVSARGSNHWGDSGMPDATRGLRPWLNSAGIHEDEGFYRAFSNSFSNVIISIDLPNREWENGESYLTEDKVFIPSITELGATDHTWTYEIGNVYEYFRGATNADRVATLGDGSVDWRGWYWTRSPLSYLNPDANDLTRFSMSKIIDENGSYTSWHVIVDRDDYCGIRPAVNMHPAIAVQESATFQGVYELIFQFDLRLSAMPETGGSVDGDGSYNHGDEVTVTATANEGYKFVNWSENGEVISTEAQFSFTIESDRDLTASFEQLPTHEDKFDLRLSAMPETGGSVDGDGSYNHGDEVTVTATANEGYKFMNWSGNGEVISTEAQFSFTIESDRDLTASFEQLPTHEDKKVIYVQNQATGDVQAWLVDIDPINVENSQITSRPLIGTAPSPRADWHITAVHDIDGSGSPDLIWHNSATGQRRVWKMDSFDKVLDLPYGAQDRPNLVIADLHDMDGDGKPDAILQNPAGGRFIWFMDEHTKLTPLNIPGAGPNWNITGVDDMGADGKTNIIWEHNLVGGRNYWTLDEQYRRIAAESGNFFTTGPQWKIVAVHDMDGDGNPDIIWEHRDNGNRSIWLIDNMQQDLDEMMRGTFTQEPVTWTIVGAGTIRNISGAVTYDWSRKVEEMVEPFDPTVLNLTDARGNRYTLHIPLEADLFGIDVAMVAVQSIEDFPMSGGLLGGVGLLPDGLVLIEPATLVVKPADSSAVEEWLQSSPDHRLLGYTHAEDGEYFHYYPYTIHGDEIHFTVPCFRGFGLGLATGDDIARHLARPAMTAAIEANRAAAPVFGDLAARRLLGNPSASFSDAEKTALTQAYNRWFDQRVGPLCTEGEADVKSLDQAIIEYLQWVAAVTQSGTDHTQRNRQALNTIERGISNYLSRVQSSAWGARELTLPIASAQDQSQFEQRRKELYASLARIYGLDNLDSILENMGRGFDFILKSTITFNEGTEDEIRVSVRSDPVLLNWSKIIDHVPRLSTLVGTAAISHTDFYIPWEDDECYDVIYHLTPGTIKVELFAARNALRATPEGVGFTIKFLSNEEFVQRSFVVIRIMPLEAGFTIIDICGDPPDPPRTTPTAPVWLGSFSVFHQDTLFSEGMLFRNWQCTPTPPGFSGILEFDQVGAYGVRERTTMRYYSP